MLLAVPRETGALETRVALVPDSVTRLSNLGIETVIEAGAGKHSMFPDEDYAAAGARIAEGPEATFAGAELIAKVAPPSEEEARSFPEGATLVGFLHPARDQEVLSVLATRKATVFSFDRMPRISRAQAMDALSSQATITGYRAALVAATSTAKLFPMLMTAAGTIPPAKVLVMGAGVAGLQAIATCRRLGAVVRAYDVRAAAAEEVASLGATFVQLELETQEGEGGYAKEQSEEFLRAQQNLIAQHVEASDVVITTAAIPGRRAPLLVTEEMVAKMTPGSVIVDVAADTGGNCELTKAGETVKHNDVAIIGIANPPASMPTHASALYARNVVNLVALLTKEGRLEPDFEDEIIKGCCVLREGEPTEGKP